MSFSGNFSTGGQNVSWRHIEGLQKLQDKEGLSCGNKLTSRHTHFWQQKMKVSLCVQTLSSSVADSIRFCRERLNHNIFNDSEGTEKFLRVMDHLFDVLNSSCPKAKNWKKPIALDGLHQILPFLEHSKNYIRSMKKEDGTLLINTQRNMGFIGFLINIQTMENLIAEKILTRKWQYILPYKFSQDHLELLFNSIRGAGQYTITSSHL